MIPCRLQGAHRGGTVVEAVDVVHGGTGRRCPCVRGHPCSHVTGTGQVERVVELPLPGHDCWWGPPRNGGTGAGGRGGGRADRGGGGRGGGSTTPRTEGEAEAALPGTMGSSGRLPARRARAPGCPGSPHAGGAEDAKHDRTYRNPAIHLHSGLRCSNLSLGQVARLRCVRASSEASTATAALPGIQPNNSHPRGTRSAANPTLIRPLIWADTSRPAPKSRTCLP